ncbi:hypothetical protein BT69DRAFT_1280709, partial [Atractiella rhizophila]
DAPGQHLPLRTCKDFIPHKYGRAKAQIAQACRAIAITEYGHTFGPCPNDHNPYLYLNRRRTSAAKVTVPLLCPSSSSRLELAAKGLAESTGG